MGVVTELSRYLILGFSDKWPKEWQPENQKVIISLTTLPERIDKIKPTLFSLLDQSVKPDYIRLNIPKTTGDGNPFPVPQELKNVPGLRIYEVEKDLGPGTKFLPVLTDDEVSPDTLVIVLDDDQVYPQQLVESYLEAAGNHPDAALTLCGWKAPKSLKHQDKHILHGAGLKVFKPAPNISGPTDVEIIQGASSYAIRKNFFDQAVLDYSRAPKGAFFADDIWISGHLAKREVPRKIITPGLAYCRLQSPTHFSTQGLRDTANIDNSNNDALYRYFENDWKLYN